MDVMNSLQGLPGFLLYFAVGIAAEALFLALYMAVTPHHEFKLIEAGNRAAAVSLGGAVLGFTLPLASAATHSVSLVDMAVWSLVALVAQLIVFVVVSMLLRGLSKRIEAGDMAAATTVATASIAIGVLNAASMSY
jgi:putative membrane protein